MKKILKVLLVSVVSGFGSYAGTKLAKIIDDRMSKKKEVKYEKKF